MKKATKDVVQYGKAIGPSGYGQITWHFQTGPCPITYDLSLILTGKNVFPFILITYINYKINADYLQKCKKTCYIHTDIICYMGSIFDTN